MPLLSHGLHVHGIWVLARDQGSVSIGSWAMAPSKLGDMWQQHGPNAWTHVGKVLEGTRLHGEGGLYAEADFKVGGHRAHI